MEIAIIIISSCIITGCVILMGLHYLDKRDQHLDEINKENDWEG